MGFVLKLAVCIDLLLVSTLRNRQVQATERSSLSIGSLRAIGASTTASCRQGRLNHQRETPGSRASIGTEGGGLSETLAAG
jgi:hypothetical protein